MYPMEESSAQPKEIEEGECYKGAWKPFVVFKHSAITYHFGLRQIYVH